MHRFPTPPARAEDEVSLFRLYVLRAMYLLLIVGLGGMIVPEIVSHPLTDRGVIAEPARRGLAARLHRPSLPARRCCRC